ncbi:MAG: hypothetical protein HYV16_13920 [Gammaproteobacteria bacterium]|nr:hypothetical protein [Gammaproteobacteria bacterium]
MFKRIVLTVSALAIVAVILAETLASWVKNPYGLEAERLGPKGNESLPPILTKANAKNYILYPKYEENVYVIHLALPNHYVHNTNITDRIVKSYSASASMYYPGLNGKFHSDNANLAKCSGYCGGYIRAFIQTNQNSAHALSSRVLERISHDRQQGSSLYKFEDLTPEFGIDEHFQIRYPVIEAKSKGGKASSEEYLIARDRNGEVKYLFECTPYTPSPACRVTFNLSSRPELVVDITFGRHLMAEWQKVIQSVNEKIASWGPVRIELINKQNNNTSRLTGCTETSLGAVRCGASLKPAG